MPKPMFVWSGSAWVSVATEVESLANYATINYADNQPGMKMVVPTSVAVGSGSGSVSTSGAVTFSGASSVSINGCFSSTYDNYRIVFTIPTAGAGAPFIGLQMRTGSTNASGSNYYGQSVLGSSTSITGERLVATTTFRFARTETGNGGSAVMDIYRPFLAASTNFTSTGGIYDDAQVLIYNGQHRVSTSYESFTIIPESSNITGTIRVYGYKN